MSPTHTPDLLPVLSAGKHRNPRKGACFMEFASYLAGERWSDQPACTHELLAGVARLVNDNVSERTRSRLVVLIPRVVGLNPCDPAVYPMLSIRAASIAVPIAPSAHQRALAVGMLSSERYLDDHCDGVPDAVAAMLATGAQDAPEAFVWARAFRRGLSTSSRMYVRRAAPRIVLNAVDGIVRAAPADADALLYTLLDKAIADCEAVAAPASVPSLSTRTSPRGSLAPTS